LLEEALLDRRVFVTKDHDIGVLVYGKGAAHAGVLLIDDLGDPVAEAALLRSILLSHAAMLGEGRFLRAGDWGVRVGEDPKRHPAT
jgi:hypothetical protein